MKFSSARFLILALAVGSIVGQTFAQDAEVKKVSLEELKNSAPPSAAEVMRGKIAKAKSYLVVKNYPAAIYELENIRKETNDPTVHRVLNVLLMHSYLEQSNYSKAQKFLTELSKNKTGAEDYYAVAGQVVSGAKTQLARYQALGLQVNDGGLHEAAVKDLDGMRKTLELIVKQTKTIGVKSESKELAAVMLEESSAARKDLARDDYDTKLWGDQVAEAREQIVAPRTNVLDAVEKPVNTPDLTLVATKIEPTKRPDALPKDVKVEDDAQVGEENKTAPVTTGDVSLKPVADGSEKQKESETAAVAEKKEVEQPAVKKDVPAKNSEARVVPSDRKVRVVGADAKNEEKETPKAKDETAPDVKSVDQLDKDTDTVAESPMDIGSLIAYATRRVNPVYPRQARSMRIRGTVKVEVVVDEMGEVAELGKTSGPSLLKRAAQDAVRKWRFRPFEKDGQPVKAAGYVSFNFK